MTQASLYQYWPYLLRYHNDFDNRFGQYSLAPSMLDQFQNYADGANTVRNPLGSYGDNSMENTRGSYAGMVVNSNVAGATTAALTLTFIEPIFVSPLVSGCGSNYTCGLVGVDNMSYISTFANIDRILSLVQNQGAPGGINILTQTTHLQSATLLFEYLTPDSKMSIPRSLVSAYYSLVCYPTKTSQLIAPGGGVSITMQSVQLASIPRRIYVYAKIDDSVATPYTSDVCFGLPPDSNPLQLTWNNNQFFSALLSCWCWIVGCSLFNEINTKPASHITNMATRLNCVKLLKLQIPVKTC